MTEIFKWSHNDFIELYDVWLNRRLLDTAHQTTKRDFVDQLMRLKSAGFNHSWLLDIPYFDGMSEHMITAKIKAHKTIHESGKQFMLPEEEKVEEAMSDAFFRLLENDGLFQYVGYPVTDWTTTTHNFDLKFRSFVKGQDLEDDKCLARCVYALRALR